MGFFFFYYPFFFFNDKLQAYGTHSKDNILHILHMNQMHTTTLMPKLKCDAAARSTLASEY